MCSDLDIHSTSVRAKRCINSYQNNVYVVLVEITKDKIQTLPAMGSTEYIVLETWWLIQFACSILQQAWSVVKH